jgi:CO/xanthine dehydrogenase Mo-binding subunit
MSASQSHASRILGCFAAKDSSSMTFVWLACCTPLTVITAADIGSPLPTIPLRLAPLIDLVPYEQPVIASGKVRYVGEPVAVVIAESSATAEDALDLIELDIEALPPCVDTTTAASNRSLLFEEAATNLALTYTAVLGDADAAFAAATADDGLVRRERLATQRHTATTMETRGLAAHYSRRGEAEAGAPHRRCLAFELCGRGHRPGGGAGRLAGRQRHPLGGPGN